MIQLSHSRAVEESTCWAISPRIALAAKTPPHIAVSTKLARLKPGWSQPSRGVVSRAYCSVNGVKASESRGMTARAPLEIVCE